MVTATKPLVVVDWGAIRALPKGSSLRGDAWVILADIVVCEIAGSEEPVLYARKLREVLRKCDASRVFVGHYWDHLSRLEKTPGTELNQNAVINEAFTIMLRESLAEPDSDWDDRITSLVTTEEFAAYERRRSQFISKCEAWTTWIRDRQADVLNQMVGDVPAQHEWIRIPGQVTKFLVQNNPGRFDAPEWQEALSVFPDRLAAGRWARIIIWYALMRSLDPTGDEHAFENNWDDAHYAFLASYTGCIATFDKGLKRLLAAVFPSVSLCSLRHCPAE